MDAPPTFGTLLARLSQAAEQVCVELQLEPDRAGSRASWQDQLWSLAGLAVPIAEAAAETRDPIAKRLTLYLRRYREHINAAVNDLGMDTPIIAGSAALDSVHAARWLLSVATLDPILEPLLNAREPHDFVPTYPDQKIVQKQLAEMQRHFRVVVATATDRELDLVSRRALLASLYVEVSHPYCVDSSFYVELVRHHDQILRRMTPGYSRWAVARRRDFIASYIGVTTRSPGRAA